MGNSHLLDFLGRTYRIGPSPEELTETNTVVYSAKAFGGVLGVGVAALITLSWGYAAVFLVAGAVALGSAALCPRLRQPGRIPVLPRSPAPA
jgi:hypothetical protein